MSPRRGRDLESVRLDGGERGAGSRWRRVASRRGEGCSRWAGLGDGGAVWWGPRSWKLEAWGRGVCQKPVGEGREVALSIVLESWSDGTGSGCAGATARKLGGR